VHQAGAVLDGHEVGRQHPVGVRTLLIFWKGHELEGPLVGHARQVAAAEPVDDLPALAEHLVEQRLGHHDLFALFIRLAAVGGPGHDISDVRMDGDRGVGHERPRRGGPDEQGRPARQRPRCDREPDRHRRVDHRLIAARLAELVVGQRSAAARAVRADAMVADQQALVEDDLEGPPHGFDVVGVHRAVGLGGVDPIAHPLAELFPGVDVPEHRLAAAGVELGDAVGLDVALAS